MYVISFIIEAYRQLQATHHQQMLKSVLNKLPEKCVGILKIGKLMSLKTTILNLRLVFLYSLCEKCSYHCKLLYNINANTPNPLLSHKSDPTLKTHLLRMTTSP